jgi:hypothetical protein
MSQRNHNLNTRPNTHMVSRNKEYLPLILIQKSMFFDWIRVDQYLGCRTYWLNFTSPTETVADGGFCELLLGSLKQLK